METVFLSLQSRVNPHFALTGSIVPKLSRLLSLLDLCKYIKVVQIGWGASVIPERLLFHTHKVITNMAFCINVIVPLT